MDPASFIAAFALSKEPEAPKTPPAPPPALVVQGNPPRALPERYEITLPTTDLKPLSDKIDALAASVASKADIHALQSRVDCLEQDVAALKAPRTAQAKPPAPATKPASATAKAPKAPEPVVLRDISGQLWSNTDRATVERWVATRNAQIETERHAESDRAAVQRGYWTKECVPGGGCRLVWVALP